MSESVYNRKRRLDETPEPAATVVEGDVDPALAPPGDRFVIHQHYATRLHHDLRLEMFNGDTPVLVSWAVPKGLPRRRAERHLAVRTEDHPIEYIDFTGSIPGGNYGAGEVRIFDEGTYEMTDRETKKISFRLEGSRLQGIYHLIKTRERDGKEEWLGLLGEDLRPERDEPPPARPMLATLTGKAFDDPDWAFEPKWDGIRAIANCNDSTQLISRNEKDITAGYPELSKLHERVVGLEAMLDGEIVAFKEGVPSFQKLQARMHVRDPAQVERAVKTNPVAFIAFDLIYLDGRSLIDLPFTERRALLEETLVISDQLQVSPSIPEEGIALFEAAEAQNLEGIVAKKMSSTYEPGGRSSSWLKIKTVFDADVIIIGWTEGGGNRKGTLGSLAMAVYDGDDLRYVGNVGTGFTSKTLAELLTRVQALQETKSPFPPALLKERPELRAAHWLLPSLVAAVEYRQVTAAGRLRVPSFKGLRDDKRPEECTFDQFGQPHS